MRVPPDHLEIAPSAFVLEVVQVTAVSPAIVRRPRMPANVSREVTHATPRSDSLEYEPETTPGHPVAVLPKENGLAIAFVSLPEVLEVPIQRSQCAFADHEPPRGQSTTSRCGTIAGEADSKPATAA